jgi:hypothetical protein
MYEQEHLTNICLDIYACFKRLYLHVLRHTFQTFGHLDMGHGIEDDPKMARCAKPFI